MPAVADLWVELRAVNGEFTKSMGEAGAAAGAADGRIAGVMAASNKMALGFGLAAVAVGAEAVKMASKFDDTMNHLKTLANVAPSQLKPLQDGVLALAGQVGFGPESLADALYHVESSFASTGISAKGAMDILKVAAEGAKIGGANLTDVTNALDAAVVSGIPGVQNYQSAMGTLLKIVGSGDMQMQDLANAFSTGILAIGKQFGATLDDVGASLAVFGDNNIRGQNAATDLRMAIMDLTKQSKPGAAALEKIGIKSGELGQKMRQGGMNAAITDLHDKLNAAGIKGNEVGQVLIDAFTKKSAAPLAILLGQFDRLQGKYKEMQSGASGFGAAWQATLGQFKTRMEQVKAQGEVWMIQLGNLLIPIITKLAGVLMNVVHWFQEHKKAAEELGKVIGTFLTGALLYAGVALAGVAASAIIAAAPFIIISLAVGALVKWLMNLYEHNAKFHAFVDGLVTSLRADLGKALAWAQNAFGDFKQAVSDVIAAVTGYYEKHKAAIDKTFKQVMQIVIQVGHIFQSAFTLIAAVVRVAVNIIEDMWSRFGQHLLDHIRTAFNAILQIVRGVLQIIQGVIDVFTGIFTGNWGKFWKGIGEIFGGVWNVIVGLLKLAINNISTVIGAAMAVISAIWGLAWHMVETLFKNVWNSILAGMRLGLNLAYSLFMAVPMKIISYVASTGEKILLWAIGVMQSMLSGIGRGWANIYAWLSNLPLRVVNAIGDIGGDMLNVGKNVVIGIWNGIAGMSGWLANKVADFAKNAVTSPIKSVLGIFSPSRVMKDEVGRYIPEGLALGITQHSQNVQQAMDKIAGIVTGTTMQTNLQQQLQGRAAQIMAGKLTAQSYGTTPAQFGGSAITSAPLGTSGGYGANGGSVVNMNITIQGSVLSQIDLRNDVEKLMLQLGFRRGTGRTYQAGNRG